MSEEHSMQVNMWQALGIWWAITWRAALLALVAAFVVGFAIGFTGGITMALAGVSPEDRVHYLAIIKIISMCAGVVIGLYFSARSTKYVINKKRFKGFRLALIPADE